MWLSVVTSWLNGAHPQTSPTKRVGRPVPNLKPHQLEFPADEELDILDALTHLSHTEGAKNADVHEDPGAEIFFSFDRLLLAWTAFSHLKIDGWKTTFVSSWFWPTFRCYISFEGRTFFLQTSTNHKIFHGFLDQKKPISVLHSTKVTTNTESFPWKIAGKGRERLLGITWNNFFHEKCLPRTFRIPFGKWSSKPGNEFTIFFQQQRFQSPCSFAPIFPLCPIERIGGASIQTSPSSHCRYWPRDRGPYRTPHGERGAQVREGRPRRFLWETFWVSFFGSTLNVKKNICWDLDTSLRWMKSMIHVGLWFIKNMQVMTCPHTLCDNQSKGDGWGNDLRPTQRWEERNPKMNPPQTPAAKWTYLFKTQI